MSFCASCFTSLVHKILRNPINWERPNDPSVTPDEAAARPPAGHMPWTWHINWLAEGRNKHTGARSLTFTADNEFICGQSIIRAEQGNVCTDASKPHSPDLQATPALQACRGLSPRGDQSEGSYKQRPSPPAELLKRKRKLAMLRAKFTSQYTHTHKLMPSPKICFLKQLSP